MGNSQVKVSVDSRIATAFKAACLSSGVSMASVLSQYMHDYCQLSLKKQPVLALDNKRKRRTAIAKLILQLRLILRAEQDYRERIPHNVHASSVFDSADHWVSVLEDVIDSLEDLS